MKTRKFISEDVKHFLYKNAVGFLLVLFVATMSVIKPTFASWENISNIINEFSIYGITACAMTAAIVCGEFDLSASSVFAWSTVLCCLIAESFGFVPAIVATLLSGCVFGIINGTLVAIVKIPAFVVTLGTMTAIKGFAYVITDAQPVSTTNATLKALGQINIGGLSSSLLVFLGVALFFIWFLKKTPAGRSIYATGGNYQVAYLSGIRVKRSKILVFMFLGICAALSGIMFSSRILAGWAPYGSDLSLYCVTATVIGGTSLAGGNGGVHRTIIGLLFMAVLFNSLTLLGVGGSMQKFVQGLVLITVIMFDAYANKKRIIAS